MTANFTFVFVQHSFKTIMGGPKFDIDFKKDIVLKSFVHFIPVSVGSVQQYQNFTWKTKITIVEILFLNEISPPIRYSKKGDQCTQRHNLIMI